MNVDVTVSGLRELEARLIELGALAGRRALTSAMRSAAKPMVAAASRNARGDDSGALSASIGVFTVRKKLASRDTVAQVGVGPIKKNRTALFVHNSFYRRKRKGIFYGHLIEYPHRVGTRKGRLFRISRALTPKGLSLWQVKKKGGRIKGLESSGTVRASPFLRPAFAATSTEFLSLFSQRLAQAVKRIERRKGLKVAKPDVAVTP